MGVLQRICKINEGKVQSYRYNSRLMDYNSAANEICRGVVIEVSYGSAIVLGAATVAVVLKSDPPPIRSRRDQNRSAERLLFIASTTLSTVETFSSRPFPWSRNIERSDIEPRYS